MLSKVLKRIEEAHVEQPLWIVGPEVGRFLWWLVSVRQPQVVLEVGTSAGYSALWMASALAEGARLWTVESHAERFDQASENIAEAGYSEKIVQVKGHAPEVFAEVHGWPWEAKADPSKGTLDFVFLDATKKETQDHFDALRPHLAPGAIVVVDNVQSHRGAGMQAFLDAIEEDDTLKSSEISLGAGLLLIQKNSRD